MSCHLKIILIVCKKRSYFFVTINDKHAKNAMRTLGIPEKGDPKVVSGESGAAGMGFLLELLSNDELAELRQKAGVNKNSKILLFSTEGDTDPDNYQRIVFSK